jgi:hypothetical protein
MIYEPIQVFEGDGVDRENIFINTIFVGNDNGSKCLYKGLIDPFSFVILHESGYLECIFKQGVKKDIEIDNLCVFYGCLMREMKVVPLSVDFNSYYLTTISFDRVYYK